MTSNCFLLYCRKCLTLSNQTSRYKSKCIRIIVLCTSYCLRGFCVGLCFGTHNFMSFLVLQSVAFFLVFGMSCKCDCLQLFLTVMWVGLQFVTVVFPNHTHFCSFYGYYGSPMIAIIPLYRSSWLVQLSLFEKLFGWSMTLIISCSYSVIVIIACTYAWPKKK